MTDYEKLFENNVSPSLLNCRLDFPRRPFVPKAIVSCEFSGRILGSELHPSRLQVPLRLLAWDREARASSWLRSSRDNGRRHWKNTGLPTAARENQVTNHTVCVPLAQVHDEACGVACPPSNLGVQVTDWVALGVVLSLCLLGEDAVYVDEGLVACACD